jgi:hypothetical protein
MRRGLSEVIKVGHARGEGEYFHDLDVELMQGLRASDKLEREHSRAEDAAKHREAQLDRERAGIAEVTRTSPEIAGYLQSLDYTPNTAPLLFLTPLLRLAWIDGAVNRAERNVILRIATESGLQRHVLTYSHLEDWLGHPPREKLLEGSWSAIKAVLNGLPPDERRERAAGLLLECRAVAAASGGALIHRTCEAERQLLRAIEQELAGADQPVAPAPDITP